MWLALPLTTRAKMAAELNIPKVRSTSVINNVVTDDGYNVKDVEEALKVIPLQNALQDWTEMNVDVLFKKVVDKIEERVEIVSAPIEIVFAPSAFIVESTPKKRGRPAKKK